MRSTRNPHILRKLRPRCLNTVDEYENHIRLLGANIQKRKLREKTILCYKVPFSLETGGRLVTIHWYRSRTFKGVDLSSFQYHRTSPHFRYHYVVNPPYIFQPIDLDELLHKRNIRGKLHHVGQQSNWLRQYLFWQPRLNKNINAADVCLIKNHQRCIEG